MMNNEIITFIEDHPVEKIDIDVDALADEFISRFQWMIDCHLNEMTNRETLEHFLLYPETFFRQYYSDKSFYSLIISLIDDAKTNIKAIYEFLETTSKEISLLSEDYKFFKEYEEKFNNKFLPIILKIGTKSRDLILNKIAQLEEHVYA